MSKDIIDRIIHFINSSGREVVPIIGTPGSGKTFFLASLTKWVLEKIDKPEKVFLQGREYLYNLAVRYSSIEVNPSDRIITNPLIERNVPTETIDDDLLEILLRITYNNSQKNSFDLFTIDGPGEILVKHPEILSAMIKNLRGLIFLVDVIGDTPNVKKIDWNEVTNNAIHSVYSLAEVIEDELREDTPIALVVTKWDRFLTLDGFKDEKQREISWDKISARLRNIYSPLIKQHKVDVFLHSSIGVYSNFDEAFKNNQEVFPFPMGIEPILQYCIGKNK